MFGVQSGTDTFAIVTIVSVQINDHAHETNKDVEVLKHTWFGSSIRVSFYVLARKVDVCV